MIHCAQRWPETMTFWRAFSMFGLCLGGTIGIFFLEEINYLKIFFVG